MRKGPTKRKPGRPPKRRRSTKAELKAKASALEADDDVAEAERRVKALAQTVRSRAGAMPAGDLRVLVSDDLTRARELHKLARERLMSQALAVEVRHEGLRDMLLTGIRAHANYLE